MFPWPKSVDISQYDTSLDFTQLLCDLAKFCVVTPGWAAAWYRHVWSLVEPTGNIFLIQMKSSCYSSESRLCLYFHLLTRLNLQCLCKDVHLAWSAKAFGGALALSNGLTSQIFAVLGRSKHGRSEPWARSSLPSESCMIHRQLFRPLQCNLKSRYFLLNRPLLWWKCRSGRLKPSSWMIHIGWCDNAAHLISSAAFVL